MTTRSANTEIPASSRALFVWLGLASGPTLFAVLGLAVSHRDPPPPLAPLVTALLASGSLFFAVFASLWRLYGVDGPVSPQARRLDRLRDLFAEAKDDAAIARAVEPVRVHFLQRSLVGWALGEAGGMLSGVLALLGAPWPLVAVGMGLFFAQWGFAAPTRSRLDAFLRRYLAALGLTEPQIAVGLHLC